MVLLARGGTSPAAAKEMVDDHTYRDRGDTKMGNRAFCAALKVYYKGIRRIGKKCKEELALEDMEFSLEEIALVDLQVGTPHNGRLCQCCVCVHEDTYISRGSDCVRLLLIRQQPLVLCIVRLPCWCIKTAYNGPGPFALHSSQPLTLDRCGVHSWAWCARRLGTSLANRRRSRRSGSGACRCTSRGRDRASRSRATL